MRRQSLLNLYMKGKNMKIVKVGLEPPYSEYDIDGGRLCPALTCMIHDSSPGRVYPGIIIVPGGSYSRCSSREGEPAAARFYSYGFNAFVLDYSCVDKKFPTALLELGAAVKYVREKACECCCNDKLYVCGFSAGGHLAASLGAFGSEIMDEDLTPDGLILCYPVITSGEFTHKESARNIAPTEALMEKISIEKHITKSFPPSFIWHCADDNVVPVENSLMLSSALSAAKVPFELHIFPEGGHGIALCDITTIKNDDKRYINPTAAQWFGLALDWINRQKSQQSD